MKINGRICHAILAVTSCLLAANTALATFHVMQIEQVIGGVNGDTTAQAIQLRMRSTFQNQVQNGRLIAHDSAGNNPVLIATFPGPVPNQGVGVRTLVVSANFSAHTSPPAVGNQTMTNLIPVSYLAAGSLTFEDSVGTIYWRVSWGGASYTGSNSVAFTNDSDGTCAPSFASALPSSSAKSLIFPGAASAPSTNNAADYTVTSGPAVFTNNAPASFTVQAAVTCGTCGGDITGDSVVDGRDISGFVNCAISGGSGCACADIDHNSTVNSADVDAFVDILLGNTASGC